MHLLLSILGLVLCAAGVSADDWPQWRGPLRDEVSREQGLLDVWPADGPPQVWMNNNAGLGYSGPAVVGDRIYLMGARKSTCYLLALDAATGREIWNAEIGDRFDNRWGNGPRATPTVDGDFVYGMSGYGDLICARTDSGDVIWRANLEDLGGEIPTWGYCESVLIDGHRLICSPGGAQGAIVALDKQTGELLWQSRDVTDDAQYSSPMLLTLGDIRMYVQLFSNSLVGVEADSGRLLWRSDWEGRVAVIPTPIVDGNRVYISSGYGVGCKRVDLSLKDHQTVNARDVYVNKVMKNHHGGVLLTGDYLYGYSDGLGWACQSLETGEEVWHEKDALGKGAVACNDGKLYCLEEDTGVVVLAHASPAGWNEISRFTLKPQTRHRKPAGKIWTHPVVSNGRLYLRDQELFFCFDIK